MSAQSDTQRLLDVSRELVRHVDGTVARYRVLRDRWHPEGAAAARHDLCRALNVVAYDREFWQALETVAQPPEDWDYLLAQLADLQLDEFEEAERALLEWAGAGPSLAAEWASSTSLVLRVIREGTEQGVPLARWVEAEREQQFVRLATEAVCGTPLPPLEILDEDAPNKWVAKRFRKRLWGAIKVGGGIGQIALNAAVLAGAAPIPGLNVGAAILGGGSILGGVWVTVAGGESLHESLADE